VRQGSTAKIAINAYPGRTFTGRVTYVYPNLSAETRTIPVRIELANPGGTLKPGMFASVELSGMGRKNVVTVPASAVIDSGVRQIVLVQTGEGRFAPRDVKLGMRSDTHVEVLEGVKDGEAVVTAANFLIDAESNLKAAIGGLATGSPAAGATAPSAASGKVGHRATGRIDAIDAKASTATVSHGPVASLRWPAMTMEFALTNPAQLKGVAPGTSIDFEFVERQPGEYVITKVSPAGASAAAPAPPASPPPAAHKH
jgi:Cu(I)/Ag(I) efflux system membrane fusion protein